MELYFLNKLATEKKQGANSPINIASLCPFSE